MVLQNFNSTNLSSKIFRCCYKTWCNLETAHMHKSGAFTTGCCFQSAEGLTNAVRNRASNSPYAAWQMFTGERQLKKFQTASLLKAKPTKQVSPSP